MAAGLDVVEGFGLVGVETGNASGGEHGGEAGIDSGGDLREAAFGGGLEVDGADGRIGVLVAGAEVRDDRFERGLRTLGQLMREFRETEGLVHTLLRLFFAMVLRNGAGHKSGGHQCPAGHKPAGGRGPAGIQRRWWFSAI